MLKRLGPSTGNFTWLNSLLPQGVCTSPRPEVCSPGCALCQGGDCLCPLEAVLMGMRYLGMFWLQAAAGVWPHDSQNSIPSGSMCPWVCMGATGGLESTPVPPSQHHPIACSSLGNLTCFRATQDSCKAENGTEPSSSIVNCWTTD